MKALNTRTKKGRRKLERCSTSSPTDVEAAHDVNEATDPLPKAKRELDESESKASGKKQKKEKKNVEEVSECSVAADGAAKTLNEHTIFVTGFDTSLSSQKISDELIFHFWKSCGSVKSISVPIVCETGVSRGFAFINVPDEREALKLNGSTDLRGRKLVVTMARDRNEYYSYSNLRASEPCRPCHLRARWECYGPTGGSRGVRLSRDTVELGRLYDEHRASLKMKESKTNDS